MGRPDDAGASAFERFREAVLADPASEQALRDLDEWPRFVAAALEIAGKLGCAITSADLDDARARATSEWLERWI